MSIKSVFEKFYKGYLPNDVLESVIECCINNKSFSGEIDFKKEMTGNTAILVVLQNF